MCRLQSAASAPTAEVPAPIPRCRSRWLASAARFWCRRRAALRSRVPQWRQWGSEIRARRDRWDRSLAGAASPHARLPLRPECLLRICKHPCPSLARRRSPGAACRDPALVWQCILASWRTRKQREPSRWREELATHDDEQGHSQAGYGVAVIDGVHGQGFWAGGGQTCPLAPMRALTEPRGGFTRMASESAATTV